MLEIDGSQGEGGGQILRTSLALSLLTGKAFRMRRIRAGRRKPGLQPQHLTSVKAAAAIGLAQLRGASLHGTNLVFEPGPVTGGPYHFRIGTAGAVSLVLHTVYLPLALRSSVVSELTFEGGTHVLASPCFHFLDTTWRHYLEILGIRVTLQMRRAGFYPRGGGVMHAEITPASEVRSFRYRDRSDGRIIGVSAVAGLDAEIAHRQRRRAMERLKRTRLGVEISTETLDGGPGTVLALTVTSEPVPALFFGLGARGKPAERVADEAVDQILAFLNASPAVVDPHSADQLVLPLVFAQGSSEFTISEVTAHLQTNIAVIRLFVDREVLCDGEIGKPGLVRVL